MTTQLPPLIKPAVVTQALTTIHADCFAQEKNKIKSRNWLSASILLLSLKNLYPAAGGRQISTLGPHTLGGSPLHQITGSFFPFLTPFGDFAGLDLRHWKCCASQMWIKQQSMRCSRMIDCRNKSILKEASESTFNFFYACIGKFWRKKLGRIRRTAREGRRIKM